ncbi:hypothetical protein K488DRAFT_52245 [Vararia minispora EC-137]|uniref:Uncharacterized protein n=1 Tax=Vararia minispora EC-137 TaxID=1314806 RepID=A0ACB8QID8_9AGAM|nr:hypothetical protein K488DRAFT_52245 [Vararia minispora EC-137]
MATNFNPLVQGWGGGGSSTSMLGALPNWTPQSSMPREALVFHITHYRPTILNSTVLDPNGQPQFRIVTDHGSTRSTIWLDAHRRTVALVDWDVRPVVEIPGLLARTPIKHWLCVSSDRTSRYMEVRGVQYQWTPVDQYICLYLPQEQDANMLARIGRVQTGVTIEVSKDAIQYGLLEVCVVAATLFLSGANFE